MMADSSFRFFLLLLPLTHATCVQLTGTARCQPGNFINDDGECCQCSQGKFSATVGQVGDCLPCPAGTFANLVGLKTCLLCPPSTFMSSEEAVLCTAVPDLASQALGFGNTEKSECDDGFITVQGICVPCGPGTTADNDANKCSFCDSSVTLDANLYLAADCCHRCPHGTVPSPKWDKCVRAPCPSGKMLLEDEETGICKECQECSSCLAGKYGAKGPNPNCQPCPVGKFLPWNGAWDPDFCVECPKGYYNDEFKGASQCKPCPEGKILDSEGGTFSEDCKFCGRRGFNPLPGQKKCLPCPLGTIASPDRKKCIVCAPGKYAPACEDEGCSEECEIAEAGTMAPRPGMANTIECPAGYSSPAGASQCTICRVGTFADSPKTPSPCADCANAAFVGATDCPTPAPM